MANKTALQIRLVHEIKNTYPKHIPTSRINLLCNEGDEIRISRISANGALSC